MEKDMKKILACSPLVDFFFGVIDYSEKHCKIRVSRVCCNHHGDCLRCCYVCICLLPNQRAVLDKGRNLNPPRPLAFASAIKDQSW